MAHLRNGILRLGIISGLLALLAGNHMTDTHAIPDESVLATKTAASTEAALLDSMSHAASLFNQRKYYDAEPMFRRLKTPVKEVFGDSSAQYGRLLDRLVGCSFQVGKARDPETIALAEFAVSRKERLFGRQDSTFAASLAYLGIIRAMCGSVDEAESLFLEVLQIRENLKRPDPRGIAITLGYISNIKSMRSDFAGAIPYVKRSLEYHENQEGRDHPRTFTPRGNLANLLAQVGDYTEARTLLDYQVSVLEARGERNEDLGKAYTLIAELNIRIGDKEEALRMAQQALAVRQEYHLPDHPTIIESLQHVGVACLELGRYDEAIDLFSRSRELHVARYGGEHLELARNDYNLADALLSVGRYEEAQEKLDNALRIRREHLGEDVPHVASVLFLMGRVAVGLERYVEGCERYSEAIDIIARYYGADHPRVATYSNSLAYANFLAGRDKEACAVALKAERIITRHIRNVSRSLPERQALLYAQLRETGVNLPLALLDHVSDSNLTARIWDGLIHSRSVVLDEMAHRVRAFDYTGDPELARLYGDYQRTSARLANLHMGAPDGDDPEDHRTILDSARRDMEEAQRKLTHAQAGKGDGWLTQRPEIGLAQVREYMPAGAAMVAFVVYRDYDTEPVRKVSSAVRYKAFVLPGDSGVPVCVNIGDGEQVDELIARWRDEAAYGALKTGRSSSEAFEIYQDAATRLRRVVWDPVAPYLDEASQVFIIPDGQLHLVNMAALQLDDGRFLIETAQRFHQLTAEREIVQSVSGSWDGGALVMGAPDFESTGEALAWLGDSETGEHRNDPVVNLFRGDRPACDLLRNMSFAPLPGAFDEVNAVAALWNSRLERKAQLEDRDKQPVKLFTGSNAKEETFKRMAPGSATIHIATHGYFLTGDCPSGLGNTRAIGLLVAEEDNRRADTVKPAAVTAPTNPLLLSGLALAGANQRHAAGPDEEDGILSAQEIAALDLSSVRWAVLSACETGTGEVLGGEGVFGLQRAFQIAGAKTTVTSLWAVQDEATGQWMSAFYHAGLDQQKSTIEAMRSADLKVLNGRRAKGLDPHPFYWAGFIASGDWR
jgi:CHAT domain-containing protein/tetratricopeptide (TPR) repeat protein